MTKPAFQPLNAPAARTATIVIGVVAVVLAVLLFSAGRGKDIAARHRPLAVAEAFDFAAATFDDYIAYSERRVRAARPSAPDAVVANLLPFRLEPAADCPTSPDHAFLNGILLTHDVLEGPYSMRFLAQSFQYRCFVVYGLLLPGHATVPGDLLNSRWEDWAAAEAFAARELADEAENIYLGGHGVGGTLAILEASANPGVDGLVLFAPALAEKPITWKAVAAPLVGWLLPGARWADVVPPWSDYIYDSAPWKLHAESDALVAATLDALPDRPFEVPVFGVVSTEDASVSAEAALAYLAERTHPLSQTLVFSRDPASPEPGQTLVSSRFPEAGIVSMSHRALVIDHNDPAFGLDGTHQDCGHYHASDRQSYDRCMAGEAVVLGEILPELLDEALLERVGFNIFIDDVTRALDAFVAPVGRVPAYLER